MTETSCSGLSGRVVLITRGAGGIGAAFVGAFAVQKARVAFVDIDAGEALVREVALRGVLTETMMRLEGIAS
jgi:D-xylose 1-dehydrogenase